jgi:DNA-binding MarR family transcriptional regulator
MLATVPELRLRALLGPGLDALIVDHLRAAPATAAMLSRRLGSTYAAVHESTSRLEGRGLLSRTRAGRQQYLRMTDATWSYFGFRPPSSSMP